MAITRAVSGQMKKVTELQLRDSIQITQVTQKLYMEASKAKLCQPQITLLLVANFSLMESAQKTFIRIT